MRDDIYQAETQRIASEQQARLDQARQALPERGSLCAHAGHRVLCLDGFVLN